MKPCSHVPNGFLKNGPVEQKLMSVPACSSHLCVSPCFGESAWALISTANRLRSDPYEALNPKP